MAPPHGKPHNPQVRDPQPSAWFQALIVVWALGGLLLTLVDPIYRLSLIALEGLTHPEVGPVHLAFAVAWSVFMVWAEGVRGFQRSFAPRSVARAFAFARSPRRWIVPLAPLVAAGLVDATPRRLAASWGVVAAVVVMVLGIRTFPQPFRGLVDLGVALALAYGTAWIVGHAVASLLGRPPEIDPELRDSAAPPVSPEVSALVPPRTR